MIHVASLIHDDVLDEAEVRRGGMAVHKLYSNKVAVLAGDYLLARASVLLARLNDVQVRKSKWTNQRALGHLWTNQRSVSCDLTQTGPISGQLLLGVRAKWNNQQTLGQL